MVIVEGERFASAVTARTPRRGADAGRAQPARRAHHRRLAAAGGGAALGQPGRAAPAARPSRWWYAAIGLVAGLILGVRPDVGAARALEWDLQRLWSGTRGGRRPRTWVVGLEPSADFSTIGEALAKAAAGDTVTVGPGEYREAVHPQVRRAARRLPRQPAEAAGRRRRGLDGRHRPRRDRRRGCAGSSSAAGPGQPLAVGLLAEDATVAVDGLEISGARDAGVDLRAGARVTLRNSLIRDNEGSGVIVRAQAEPRLERNVIIHNGHGPQRRAGVVVEPGAAPELVGNGIGGNGGEAVQGWPAATLPALARRNVLSPAPGPAPARVRRRPAPRRPATAGGGAAAADGGPDESDRGRVGRLSPSGAARRRHEPRLSRHAPARRPRRRRQVGRPVERRRRPRRAPRRRAAAAVPRRRDPRPRRPRHPRRRLRAVHRDGVHRRRGSLDRPALARPLRAERRGRSLGGARRRARSRPPVRRRRRRRDVSRHRPRRSQAAQHPRLRRRRGVRQRRADAGLARPRSRLRRRQGHPRRRRRDAQRLRQRALHVARAPDRRPRQHDERLLVARRRAVRAAGRRAAVPGQRARRADADRQRSAGAAGRLPGRPRRARASPAGPRSGQAR